MKNIFALSQLQKSVCIRILGVLALLMSLQACVPEPEAPRIELSETGQIAKSICLGIGIVIKQKKLKTI